MGALTARASDASVRPALARRNARAPHRHGSMRARTIGARYIEGRYRAGFHQSSAPLHGSLNAGSSPCPTRLVCHRTERRWLAPLRPQYQSKIAWLPPCSRPIGPERAWLGGTINARAGPVLLREPELPRAGDGLLAATQHRGFSGAWPQERSFGRVWQWQRLRWMRNKQPAGDGVLAIPNLPPLELRQS